MTKETKQKNWFKGVLSGQNELAPVETEVNEREALHLFGNEFTKMEETIAEENVAKSEVLSKQNQDKLSLDVITAMENLLSDRQLVLYRNAGLKEQVQSNNETISRIKHDLVKKEQLVQDKNKEIRMLETNLTNKQMSYDQLLEDYKEYQTTSSNDFEKISSQLEIEVNKYEMLNEESAATQHQSMLHSRELEEKIRNLEIENHKYAEQCKKIIAEKEELIQTINDFTERMSFSFSSKTNS